MFMQKFSRLFLFHFWVSTFFLTLWIEKYQRCLWRTMLKKYSKHGKYFSITWQKNISLLHFQLKAMTTRQQRGVFCVLSRGIFHFTFGYWYVSLSAWNNCKTHSVNEFLTYLSILWWCKKYCRLSKNYKLSIFTLFW